MKIFSQEKSFVWALLFWFHFFFIYISLRAKTQRFMTTIEMMGCRQNEFGDVSLMLCIDQVIKVFKFEWWEFMSPVSTHWIPIKPYMYFLFCFSRCSHKHEHSIFWSKLADCSKGLFAKYKYICIFVTTAHIFFPYSDRRFLVTLLT